MTAEAPLNLEADLMDRGRCDRHKVTTWQLAQYNLYTVASATRHAQHAKEHWTVLTNGYVHVNIYTIYTI